MTRSFLFCSVTGPAFIPYPTMEEVEYFRARGQEIDTPKGYVWQPATEGTMAGWVRARRGKTAPPGADNPG